MQQLLVELPQRGVRPCSAEWELKVLYSPGQLLAKS
jgi:hypothetical protein